MNGTMINLTCMATKNINDYSLSKDIFDGGLDNVVMTNRENDMSLTTYVLVFLKLCDCNYK